MYLICHVASFSTTLSTCCEIVDRLLAMCTHRVLPLISARDIVLANRPHKHLRVRVRIRVGLGLRLGLGLGRGLGVGVGLGFGLG